MAKECKIHFHLIYSYFLIKIWFITTIILQRINYFGNNRGNLEENVIFLTINQDQLPFISIKHNST